MIEKLKPSDPRAKYASADDVETKINEIIETVNRLEKKTDSSTDIGMMMSKIINP